MNFRLLFRIRNLFSLILLLFFSCKKEDNSVGDSSPLLHAIRGDNPGIYDQQGRYMLLRGVNYNVLGDYWQGNPDVPPTKTYSPDDIRMMAGYGFNCIRLLFSWSELEPERGVYNEAYITQIVAAIEEASKYKIYVLLDMHQDAWGKYIVTPKDSSCEFPNRGWDGAPEWATITDGASTCTADGTRESAPAVIHAFQNFWDNTDGIQDNCIKAWQELVKNTAQYPYVLGYDLINEPNLGYKPLFGESNKLGAYYGKATAAIRQAEQETNTLQHIIFFENSVTWNGQPIPFTPLSAFTDEQNIVFSGHPYFESITDLLTIEQGFTLFNTLSKAYKTIFFAGEWGFFGDPATDVEKVKRFALQEDQFLWGNTWWQWCQSPGDPHGMSWDGTQYANTSMHLIEVDKNGMFTGRTNDLYLDVLNRTRPFAICGNPSLFTSNPDNGNMHLEAKTNKKGITEIWIPGRYGTPVITGENISVNKLNSREGGTIAEINVEGDYQVDIDF